MLKLVGPSARSVYGKTGPYLAIDPAPFFRCDRCPPFARASLLFVLVDDEMLCADCWKKAGYPTPTHRPTRTQVYQQEQQTRERMLKRGGTSRHLVNKGIS